MRAGLEPEIIVLRNQSAAEVSESAARFARAVRESQIIFVPGGFSGGDEPEGSGKFITAFFRNPEVTDATMDLLKQRDGLMLGICNGFQALIKLGLVPSAKSSTPTLPAPPSPSTSSDAISRKSCARASLRGSPPG